METLAGKRSSGSDWKENPRVLYIRDLLSQQPEKVIARDEKFNKRVNVRAVAPDGSYFVVLGITEKADVETRMIVAYDSGCKALWHMPLPQSEYEPTSSLDPTGKLLAISFPIGKAADCRLLEMPAGKLLRPLKYVGPMSPEAQYWIEVPEYSLHRGQDGRPLVRFEVDSFSRATHARCFNPAGSHFLWGNRDGTVAVCELESLRKRLSEIELGWPAP